MIRKILLYLSMIPSILILLIAAVSSRLTSGFDEENVNLILEYLSEAKQLKEVKVGENDIDLLVILYQIDSHSHWIITGCIIWIVVAFYIIMTIKGGNKGGNKKAKI